MVKPVPDAPAQVIGGRAMIWPPLSALTAGEPDAQPWVRVYHRGDHCPSPDFRRRHGPLHRFDHHTVLPSGAGKCPQGRTIIYLARTFATALAEVFGDQATATVCPNYRVALLHVDADCRLQDLTGRGAAAIGALPALGSAPLPRTLTQGWARAIHRDEPAGPPIHGIHYHAAHDEGPCLALFERSPHLVEVTNNACPPGGMRLHDLAEHVATILRGLSVGYREIDAAACPQCKRGN